MVYPDRYRTWIIELPAAKTIYGSRTRQYFAEAVRNIPIADQMRPSLKLFAETGAIDVNYDGMYDYPSIGIISYEGAYFALRRRSNKEQELEEFGQMVFEGNGAVCELDPPDAIFLVAVGKDFYLNRKCNLTLLSRKEK